MENSYNVVGIMSGTSLDGLDLALCNFSLHGTAWKYRIIKAVTFPYDEEWKDKLNRAPELCARDFLLLHKDYGKFIGNAVNGFLEKTNEAQLVASHGHTIFHEPSRGLTCQIGDGGVIASCCNITTVSDFRSFDVAMGGQGAPLVPAGDEILFGEFDFCLNLGGFSNISYNNGSQRIAFDICPVNIVLNSLAGEIGLEYDAEGNTGRKGNVDKKVLEELDSLDYYTFKGPKSLGREWVERNFYPVLQRSALSTEDKLRTVYEHISEQISKCFAGKRSPVVLVTGGGAFNKFLLEGLERKGASLFIPDNMIVKYKEALIFAFLGLLRTRNEDNCLSSVTGARSDTSSGLVYTIKRNG